MLLMGSRWFNRFNWITYNRVYLQVIQWNKHLKFNIRTIDYIFTGCTDVTWMLSIVGGPKSLKMVVQAAVYQMLIHNWTKLGGKML